MTDQPNTSGELELADDMRAIRAEQTALRGDLGALVLRLDRIDKTLKTLDEDFALVQGRVLELQQQPTTDDKQSERFRELVKAVTELRTLAVRVKLALLGGNVVRSRDELRILDRLAELNP